MDSTTKFGNTFLAEACQADIDFSLEDFRRKVARWRIHWVITKCNDLPTAFCTTLDSVNPVLDPSIMCFVNHATTKFGNTFWRFRGVIGSGSLSTTSPGNAFKYIERFG
jgi:hypothetical protein